MKGEKTIKIIALIALVLMLIIVPVNATWTTGDYNPTGYAENSLGNTWSCDYANPANFIYSGDVVSFSDINAGGTYPWLTYGYCNGNHQFIVQGFISTNGGGVSSGSFGPLNWFNCGQTYCGYGTSTYFGLSDRSFIFYNETATRPPVANFSYSPSQPWIAPATITFTDTSTGTIVDEWRWEAEGTGFYAYSQGDSVFEVTLEYPGSYTISLTIENGTQSWSKSETFNVLNEAGSYSLLMSPKTGTTATNFTAAITAGVEELGATLNQFTISCVVNGVVSYCTTGGKDPIFIKQDDGNWYLDGVLYSASFPSSVPLKFNVPGIHTVVGWFFTTDPADMGTEVSDTVTVTSTPGEVKLSVEVRDSSDNALIGGSEILLRKEDGTWDNQTVGSGFRDYYVPGGNNIGIGATAAGYTDSVIEYNRFYENAKKIVLLNRISGGVPEGNNTLSVYVRKGGIPDVVGLDGATVKLNDGQTKLTPASGLAQFLVLDDETYFVTVSKYGYLTTSKYFSVSGAVNAVTIELYTPGFTTTPTLAPGETTAPGTPTTTYPPGVPMPGTTITYPPGVPVIGSPGSTVLTNGTARDIAKRNLDTWMIWGGTALIAIFVIMFIGFSGDALKKWSWLWK